MTFRILVCDDEQLVRWSIAEHLKDEGYEVALAEQGEQALEMIEQGQPDALVIDLQMPKLDGMSVLRRLRQEMGSMPIIVITANGAVDTAIEATKLGAAAYVSKPFDLRELSLQLQKVLEKSRLDTEVRYLRDRVTSGYEKMIGDSPSMMQVFETLTRLERVDAPTVLITGESGTGKDLVAQAIHARGPRNAKPYMEIDCAAMPETLIESELFGHEKGAFTDARTLKKGLFEVAAGGVIFLDEIGEMTLGTQAKLLRALENRKFKRVGGTTSIPLNAAVVAATNRSLKDEVKAGRFREDLFFRLNVVPIEIPPLRKRAQDIEPIALALVERTSKELGRKLAGVTAEAIAALRAYPWPGNVRELRNVIERILILKQDTKPLALHELPEEVRAHASDARASSRSGLRDTYELAESGIDLRAVERSFLEQALERTNGDVDAAARILSIDADEFRARADRARMSPIPV